MTGQGDRPDPGEVAVSLRAVLDAVDAGEIDADEVQRAYLAGAADALGTMGEQPTEEQDGAAHPAADARTR